MNDPSALTSTEPVLVVPLPPALLAVDVDPADEPRLPADHPRWQCDVVSLSSRARAVLATLVPTVVKTLTIWDHRLREIAFGSRALRVDAAGSYRLR